MTTGLETRAQWLDTLLRITRPVFSQLVAGQLKASIPVARGQHADRGASSPMEAFCRSFSGIAPWLQAEGLGADEKARQTELIDLVRRALAQATDPTSPDFFDFGRDSQPVVESAYLALGLLRSRRAVWNTLDGHVRGQVVNSLKAMRTRKAPFNNWLLFPAVVETFLFTIGEQDWDGARIDYALRQHDQWYKGDGAYGDGPFFHWDYYNSFAIQPMLLEVLQLVADQYPDWPKFREPMRIRARRYAAIQERLISPDGTFPPLGRSLAYRFGVFQHLGMMALWDNLPEGVSPAQVRCALTAVMKRTLHAAGTFDNAGWLTVGLAGQQPALAEYYIATGSVYMCANGFLPLGLSPQHPFWSAPDEAWTAKKLWAGENVLADHCLDDRSSFPLASLG